MPGTMSAVGVCATLGILAVGLATAGAAAGWAQRLHSAADGAALAAADAAAGAVDGAPCALAAEIARAMSVDLADCEVDELVATVAVHAEFLAIGVTARARAGPPWMIRGAAP